MRRFSHKTSMWLVATMAFFMFATVLSPFALAAEMQACLGEMQPHESHGMPACCPPLAPAAPEACDDPGDATTMSSCDHHRAKDKPESTQRVDTPSDVLDAHATAVPAPVAVTRAPAPIAPERTSIDFLSGTLLRI